MYGRFFSKRTLQAIFYFKKRTLLLRSVLLEQASMGCNVLDIANMAWNMYSMDQINNSPLVKSRVVQICQKCLDTLFWYQKSTKKWWKLIRKAYNRVFILQTILNWLCCIIFDPLEVFQPNLKFRLSITRTIWHNFLK